MTIYQWVTIGTIVAGFLGTWLIRAFMLGRAIEQMKASFENSIDAESEKIIGKIKALEEKFIADQRTQDHNFGEVGAAMRQYTSDVEKKVREVEIWGRDNYVQKGEFEKATDRLEAAIKEWGADIKEDLRDRLDDLRKSFEAKH